MGTFPHLNVCKRNIHSVILPSQHLHFCWKFTQGFRYSNLFSVDNIVCIFTFLQTPLGPDYKDCLIIKNEHYTLPGVQKLFSSLRELTSYYQHNKLLLAEVPVKLGRCSPPRPKGVFSNSLIIYNKTNNQYVWLNM